MRSSIKVEKLFFVLFQSLAILFWGLPEILQKIPKILILFCLCYLALDYALTQKKLITNIILPILGVVLLFFSVYHSTFQTSVINIALSFFCIPFAFEIASDFTPSQKRKARNIAYFLCICMFLQLCIFRSEDGRPRLGYEINWSAAYLFIFFLYSKYIDFKFGRIFVIIVSLLILSRLLVLSLVLYYLISWGVKKFRIRWRINWYMFQIIAFTGFFIFNGYFILNVERGEAYDSSINRLGSFNDGSNMIRFTINTNVVTSIPTDNHLKFGYGRITGKNQSPLGKEYSYNYYLMPHNELLDCLVEFGYIFTIYAWIFSAIFYNRVFKWYNFSVMVPILVYTLILWARFLIVPSLEMFFIISLVVIRYKANTMKKENLPLSQKYISSVSV